MLNLTVFGAVRLDVDRKRRLSGVHDRVQPLNARRTQLEHGEEKHAEAAYVPGVGSVREQRLSGGEGGDF